LHFSIGNFDGLVKVEKAVTPAKAGVQNYLNQLDSHFRGNDENGAKRTFYEAIIFNFAIFTFQ